MTLIKSISGIRGTLGGKPAEGLTPIDIVKFASAFGQWIKRKYGGSKIVIGRDARPSGEALSQLVTQTLIMSGFDVVDLGLSTTPTVEIAITEENAHGGIILTASHNPIEWNALKLLNQQGEFISSEDGRELLEIAETDNFTFATVQELGQYSAAENLMDRHIEMILELDLVDREAIASKGFRVVVDAVNSTGGIAVPKLLKALGIVTIRELNCFPDGKFAHNPEPLPEHLGEITSTMSEGGYDLGIVVDPDVDRLALICENGNFFGEEYTLVAVADYVLQHIPGNTVSNLSSTQALAEITSKYGGKYYSASVGEVNVVTRMKDVNAVIGGEGNGGVIFPELHFGRDALVGIALFLSSLAKSGKSASQLRSEFPDYVISKNKIELTPGIDIDFILQEIGKIYKNLPQNTEDGLRISFPDRSEWVHLRKSNTEPIIRIYAEAPNKDNATLLAQKVITHINEFVKEKA